MFHAPYDIYIYIMIFLSILILYYYIHSTSTCTLPDELNILVFSNVQVFRRDDTAVVPWVDDVFSRIARDILIHVLPGKLANVPWKSMVGSGFRCISYWNSSLFRAYLLVFGKCRSFGNCRSYGMPPRIYHTHTDASRLVTTCLGSKQIPNLNRLICHDCILSPWG